MISKPFLQKLKACLIFNNVLSVHNPGYLNFNLVNLNFCILKYIWIKGDISNLALHFFLKLNNSLILLICTK